MTHRQNGLLAFSWLDNPLSLYQQFIQIERLFSAGGWEDVRHHDEPHRRCEPESAQWHHPQEGVEERDEQATKRALRDEMTQKQVPWATGPRPQRRGNLVLSHGVPLSKRTGLVYLEGKILT